jgi:hypothetical protein
VKHAAHLHPGDSARGILCSRTKYTRHSSKNRPCMSCVCIRLHGTRWRQKSSCAGKHPRCVPVRTLFCICTIPAGFVKSFFITAPHDCLWKLTWWPRAERAIKSSFSQLYTIGMLVPTCLNALCNVLECTVPVAAMCLEQLSDGATAAAAGDGRRPDGSLHMCRFWRCVSGLSRDK